ncbi:MAG: hypothetical protein JWO38_1191 [Gemmataceae bacterium]|nr:hypothetical protein [Gemmataceae bacterium]
MNGGLPMGVDRGKWPLVMQLGLWGLPTRGAAWGFFWLSVVIALACVGMGFVNPFFFVGGLTATAALWYYLAIRWVDRNSRWG